MGSMQQGNMKKCPQIQIFTVLNKSTAVQPQEKLVASDYGKSLTRSDLDNAKQSSYDTVMKTAIKIMIMFRTSFGISLKFLVKVHPKKIYIKLWTLFELFF